MGLRSHRFAGDSKLEAAAISDPAHILRGAVGQHVAKIQHALIELDGAVIDPGELQRSQYGPSTANAVLNYKRKRNIINRSYQTQADDIVGKMTIAALDHEMLEHETDLELEIEGPYALHPQGTPAEMRPHFALASFAIVAQARPRPRPGRPRRRPRPAPVTEIVITGTPQMPLMSFRANVRGADPTVVQRTAFHWVLAINFDASNCRHGPRRTISKTQRQTIIGDAFIPFFSEIRGGSLTVTVTATINGRRITDHLSNVRIVATNPTRQDLFAALPHNTLRRVCLQESIGGRQFDAPPNGGVGRCPLWSGDGLGGVGLFQITNPAPTDDEVWNWRTNVAGGIRIFGQKLAAARGYAAQVRGTHRFRQLVDAFNAGRHARHLAPLTITLPDFTTGDFDNNLQQLELDTIRGFNGFAGGDGFGLHLHEFRVALDHGRLRVQNIDEHALTGEAMWERVPVADRPQGTGDPNYVAHVLGQTL
jgi:hypothetical protein